MTVFAQLPVKFDFLGLDDCISKSPPKFHFDTVLILKLYKFRKIPVVML